MYLNRRQRNWHIPWPLHLAIRSTIFHSHRADTCRLPSALHQFLPIRPVDHSSDVQLKLKKNYWICIRKNLFGARLESYQRWSNSHPKWEIHFLPRHCMNKSTHHIRSQCSILWNLNREFSVASIQWATFRSLGKQFHCQGQLIRTFFNKKWKKNEIKIRNRNGFPLKNEITCVFSSNLQFVRHIAAIWCDVCADKLQPFPIIRCVRKSLLFCIHC